MMDTRLMPAQREAVVSMAANTVVTAGAGSGKTRVVVQRLLWLMRAVTEASNILAITFTNKAADEMRHRLQDLVRKGGGDDRTMPTICTCHAFCVRVIRSLPHMVGRTERFWILDEADTEEFIRRAGRAVGSTQTKLQALRRDERVMAEYANALRAADAVDFDMLEEGALRILREPEGRALWAGRFTDVLVDEYQDTNDAQEEIVSLLAPARRFVVGDARQSIYGFRGAKPEIIRRCVTSNDWTSIYLAENFRSGQEVVAVANQVCCDDAPMVAMREEPGYVGRTVGPSIDGLVRSAMHAGYHPSQIAILGRTWAAVSEAAETVTVAPVHVMSKETDAWGSALGRALIAVVTLTQSPHADWLACRVAERWLDPNQVPAMQREATESRRMVLSLVREQMELPLAEVSETASAVLRRFADMLPGKEEQRTVRWFAAQPEAWLPVEMFTVRMAMRSPTEQKPKPDSVQALTVHASKGLEWPVVILPDARDGVYPSQRGDQEEDRRVFYVACTRAQDVLLLTRPASITNRWTEVITPTAPSPFLATPVPPTNPPAA